VVETVLEAHRGNVLLGLAQKRRTLVKGLHRRYLRSFTLVPNESSLPTERLDEQIRVFLRWAVGHLRPDGAKLDAEIPSHIWLHHTQWRPFIALACFYGFLPVPAFKNRYIAIANAPVAEHIIGLWDIAPSSFYRYVERGRAALVELLGRWPPTPPILVQLIDVVQQHEISSLAQSDQTQLHEWHAAQAKKTLLQNNPRLALWHLSNTNNTSAVLQFIGRYAVPLAGDPCTDLIIHGFIERDACPEKDVRGHLALAILERIRGADVLEHRHMVHALNVASADNNPGLLALVYSATGRFYESRDIDRAMSNLRQGIAYFEQIPIAHVESSREISQSHAITLIRLGWLYLTRNDPRAREILQRAGTRLDRAAAPDETTALLYQAEAELSRRDGRTDEALEAMHLALAAYERAGNLLQQLRVSSNLSLLFGEKKDLVRAKAYAQKVFDVAHSKALDPDTVASTHLNLGGAYFWSEDYSLAIEHYLAANTISEDAKLTTVSGRAHYNLAEAYYQRYKLRGNSCDEQDGDTHAAASAAIWKQSNDLGALAATNNLKETVAGTRDTLVYDQMLPDELATHFQQMGQIQRMRQSLAGEALNATEKIEAHLSIARAYAEIAAKERNTVVEMLDTLPQSDQYQLQVEQIQLLFERSENREAKRLAVWTNIASDIQAPLVTRRLITELSTAKSINKGSYATLFSVSPATASKRLTELANRGLLLRKGNGPQTHYVFSESDKP
jgi:tetratricopeptide (TPR) repeat protein